MRDDLLFELTPGEYWVLSYLVHLAENQGSNHVILPRPGEDTRAEAVYSRSRMRRILKALRQKMKITRLIIHAKRNSRIEVFISESVLRALAHANENPEENKGAGAREKGSLGALAHVKGNLGATTHAIKPDVARVLENLGDCKLSSNFKYLLELGQTVLKESIKGLSPVEIRRYRTLAQSIHGRGVKCSVREQAKLYAEIRFLQEEAKVSKPQAWLDQLARREEPNFYTDKTGDGLVQQEMEGSHQKNRKLAGGSG